MAEDVHSSWWLFCLRCKPSWPRERALHETFPRQLASEARCNGRSSPLPKTTTANQFIVVITDRYTTNLINPVIKIHCSKFCQSFSINASYTMRDFQLSCHGQWSKVCDPSFETSCAFLWLNHIRTTAYHLQMSEQADFHNKTGVTRFNHHVPEYQLNWYLCVQK